MSKMEIVNDAGFNSRTASGAVLVEFSSPTCAPCRQIEPVLERMADEFKGKVQFLKVNVNDSPQTTARFRIRSVPTMLFMINGSVTGQLVGAVSFQAIQEKLSGLTGDST
ncbi:MAG TPA: thioredoxin [Candidatus Aminicenantes bacterium]|nr:thioredoxin [Candidatus Aminicenantes bacterium]